MHRLFLLNETLFYSVRLKLKVGCSNPSRDRPKSLKQEVTVLVSARLVEAASSDWLLFRVLEQRLIKWFGKSCPIFELGLHLIINWTMPTSIPALASIVYLQHPINFPLSRNLHFLPSYVVYSQNMHLGNIHRHYTWPSWIAYLWSLQCVKRMNCNFPDNEELKRWCR